MKLKALLITSLVLTSSWASASATRTVDADALRSADHTKTWTLPASSDALAGKSSPTFAPNILINNGNITDVNTLLLLHGDESPLTDSSSSPHTLSSSGVVRSSTQSEFGGFSAHFDGASTVAVTTNKSVFDFGSSAFTIDFWFYDTHGAYSGSGQTASILSRGIATDGAQGTNIGIDDDTGTMYFRAHGGGVWNVTLSFGTTSAAWHHYAIVRNGDTWTTYKDGSQVSTTTSSITIASAISYSFALGFYQTYVTGYLDEFRVSNVARWTAPFSVPGAPYSASPSTITISAPPSGASYGITFPGGQSSANQSFLNDGSGNLSWFTPLSTSLTSANIFVGNASNIAIGVPMTGDASISNSGAVTLKPVGTAGSYLKVVTDAQGRVSSGSNALTSANIWIGNASNIATAVAITGDATISNTGAIGIGAGKLTSTMLDGVTLVSGTYSPTLTASTNVSAGSIDAAFYIRIGSIVMVSIQAQIDTVSAGLVSQILLTLPVASDLTSANDVAGNGVAQGNIIGAQAGMVYGEPTSDKALYNFTSTLTTNVSHGIVFMYVIK